MKVPFLSLKRQYDEISTEIDAAIKQVIADTAFVGGKYVKQFEKNFSDYIGLPFGFGVSSGTSALHTALLALDVGTGDEVLLPSYTFIATAEPVVSVGGLPVFVDSNPFNFSMDVADLEQRITNKTKAIIVVHLHGMPAEMNAIMAIAKKYNLKIIEDCAQAHGASYHGKGVGQFGDIACFSFYPGKNLGAYGDGGFVATKDEKLAERIHLIRDHGRREKYVHLESGYCYRLDGIQAAILDVKLRYLNEWIERRREIAQRYLDNLENTQFVVQKIDPSARHVFHLFVLLVKKRDDFLAYLKEHGIQAGIHYPIPLHLQPAFAHLKYPQGSLPVSERICQEVVSLPIFPELTEAEQNHVIDIVNQYEDGKN